MKVKISILVLATICLFSCSKQMKFVHTVTEMEGFNNAKLAYAELGLDPIVINLQEGDFEVDRVNDSCQIAVQSASGTTIFSGIPPKYINMDLTLELSQNVFKDYFPKEWEALKTAKFTSIRLKSKKDEGVFITLVNYTNSSTEIGRHSEDF